MTTTVWILGDQLTPRLSSLAGLTPDNCVILMVESLNRARQRPYHKQKLTLLWSAMRHFAAELRQLGYTVDYYPAQPKFSPALATHLTHYQPTRLRVMETAEHGGAARLAELAKSHGAAVEITPNNMFLSNKDEFARWSQGKKTVLLENFYRRMRRQTGLLMDGSEPAGGQWNYDQLNRQRPPADHVFPTIPRFEPTELTRQVMKLVEQEFPDHFGQLDDFWLPVTRAEAETFAADFLDRRLDLFGPYEDAIVAGERALYHSLLSSLLNLGLLEPLELCRQAEARYYSGQARLNSVEGFIRQLIGWREFVYQMYHWQMPGYLATNHLAAELPLPEFYWTGQTDMFCIAEAVTMLRRYGVNHHIQRLMITGNFALIAGLDPQAVNEWYWLAYTDAYEWVVSPNVLGLALYADGGLLASKPYAASANYINKMSDCCRRCRYKHRQTVGPDACPFNSLYWDFLACNYPRLIHNPRMKLVLANLNRRNPAELTEIRAQAKKILAKLRRGERI